MPQRVIIFFKAEQTDIMVHNFHNRKSIPAKLVQISLLS